MCMEHCVLRCMANVPCEERGTKQRERWNSLKKSEESPFVLLFCSAPLKNRVSKLWFPLTTRSNAHLSCRRGLGSRPLCTRSASTAWRARGRASRAPIHSDLQDLPYRGRGAWSEGARPDFSRPPQTFPELNQWLYEILMDHSKYWQRQNKNP
jgi:hypothetical protein